MYIKACLILLSQNYFFVQIEKVNFFFIITVYGFHGIVFSYIICQYLCCQHCNYALYF